MKITLAFTLSLFLSSCMHPGMMGTHGGSGSGDHQTESESVLEKEVEFGGIKATAIFPSLRVGEETMFTLKLMDKTTGQPVSNAMVSFHVSFVHAAEKGRRGAMHHNVDSSQAASLPAHDMNFDREVEEISSSGVYSIGFTPSQAGEHKTMFHIVASGEQEQPPEVIIETTRHAASTEKSNSGMMHGMGGVPEYAIIGAVVMGAMMLVVWASGGRMF